MKAPAERLEAVTGRNPPFGTNVGHFIAMNSFLKLVAETGSRSVVPRKARSRSGLQSKNLVIYLMSPLGVIGRKSNFDSEDHPDQFHTIQRKILRQQASFAYLWRHKWKAAALESHTVWSGENEEL
jgi:hypothetical protein